MTAQAMNALLDGAAKNTRKTKKDFAHFYYHRHEAYSHDEALGANGSYIINMTMIEAMIKAFEDSRN
jgi:hypothetical protein